MLCFWSRKKECPGGLSELPAPGAVDFEMFLQDQEHKDWLDHAKPWQEEVGDPEFSVFCRHRRPGKRLGLGRILSWRGLGKAESRDPYGSGHGASGMQAEVVDGEALGTCRNSRGGKSPPAKLNPLSVIQPPREDAGDAPSVGRQARDGDLPRERGGLGMDQTQPPVQAGANGDEEGRASDSSEVLECRVEDRDAPTIPGKDGEGEDSESPAAEGMSGEEQRSQVWQELPFWGEDMESWAGKPMQELAALQKHTRSHPSEQGSGSGSGQRPEEVGDPPVTVASVWQETRPLGPWEKRSFHELLEANRIERLLKNYELRQGSEWSPWEDEEFCRLLPAVSRAQWKKEFPEVWARHRMDCGKVDEELRLDGPPGPFQEQPPLAPGKAGEVEEMLGEFLAEGIVVKGRSDSNNPLKPVWEGSKLRLILDCKALHEVTATGPQERLDRNEVLARIPAGSSWFSVVDLSCASFAIPLARSCWRRFAFTFRGQQYLFTRLPQGFRATTSILQRHVARMLSQLGQGDTNPWAFHYVDDILIVGGSAEEAAARTRAVLELIQRTGFKAKLEKAQLVLPEVTYLGVTVGAKGRRVPPAVLEELLGANAPCNARCLRSLLGQFGAWQGFIPDYQELVLPLWRRVFSKARWRWPRRHRRQLWRLKEALKGAPALRFPDRSQPFLVRMSVHQDTAGAMLLQERGSSWEPVPLEPVQFFSRTFKGSKNLSLDERCCVAAAWAVRAFQPFVGSAPVIVTLPHAPGRYLFRGVRPREQWHLLLVSEAVPEDSDVVSLPAPPLCLLPPHVPASNVWFLASHRHQEGRVGFAAASLEERWLLGVSRDQSQPATEVEALAELLEQHRSPQPIYLYSGSEFLVSWLLRQDLDQRAGHCDRAVWWRIVGWCLHHEGRLHVRVAAAGGSEGEWVRRVSVRAAAVAASGTTISGKSWEPSKYERQEIISQCHRGHGSEEETLRRVRAVARWDGDARDVARWVRSCPGCGAGGTGGAGPQRALGPCSCLSIGITAGLPRTPEGFCALLVVRDEVSGWLEALPLRRRAPDELSPALLRLLERLGTVHTLCLPREPPWLRLAVSQAPLREHWDTLSLCGDGAGSSQNALVTQSLCRVCRKVGQGWGEMLPLLLAAIRAPHSERAGLMPLLSVPRLPLLMLWEERVQSSRDNEVSRLGWMQVLQGYRDRVGAVLRGQPGVDPD